MKSPKSDSELIKSYLNGRSAAIEILCKRYEKSITNFIYYKIRDLETAQDISQDTFIKAITSLKKGRYKDEGKFFAWLKQVARNLINDHFRKINKRRKYENTLPFDVFEVVPDSEPNIQESIIEEQYAEHLVCLIQQLKKEHQEVVTMRIYQKMKFHEIAEATDTTINCSLGRMRYALENLRKIMANDSLRF